VPRVRDLRPGEKLTEDLLVPGEHDARPYHPPIRHVPVSQLSAETVAGLDPAADLGRCTPPWPTAPAAAPAPAAAEAHGTDGTGLRSRMALGSDRVMRAARCWLTATGHTSGAEAVRLANLHAVCMRSATAVHMRALSSEGG